MKHILSNQSWAYHYVGGGKPWALCSWNRRRAVTRWLTSQRSDPFWPLPPLPLYSSEMYSLAWCRGGVEWCMGTG